MASRYIQKYPIPEDFPLILKNFSREILRDQPQNVIEYAAKYFEALEKGQTFHYKSAFNVAKSDKATNLEYAPQNAKDMVKKDLRINSINGALDKKELQKLNKVVDMIFDKFDHDRSGKLEPSELHGMMKQLYKDGHIEKLPSDQDIRDFVVMVDTNANGKIEKNELVSFMRNLVA